MSFFPSQYKKIIDVNFTGATNWSQANDKIYAEAAKLSDEELRNSAIEIITSDDIAMNYFTFKNSSGHLNYARVVDNGDSTGITVLTALLKATGSTWTRVSMSASGNTVTDTGANSIATVQKLRIIVR